MVIPFLLAAVYKTVHFWGINLRTRIKSNLLER